MVPILPAIIGAGGSLLGGIFNSNSQQNANEQQEAFAREMYDRQKADSLAMWDKNNMYNSPEEQMKRLRAAGLNPNMVYGNGSAVNTASPINVPSQSSYHPTAPRPGDAVSGAANSGLSSYFDSQVKEASVNNMRAVNTNLQLDAAIKAATAEGIGKDNRQKDFNFLFGQDARPNNLEFLKLRNDLTFNNSVNAAQTNLFRNELFPNQLKNSDISVERALQDLTNAKRMGVGINLSNQLKSNEVGLNRVGMSGRDELWQRMLGKIALMMGIHF